MGGRRFSLDTNLSGFLAQRGLRAADVREALYPFGGSDAVCFCATGSAVEGFATSRSDLDLYLVVEDSREDRSKHHYFPISGADGLLRADLTVVALPEIAAVGRQLLDCFEASVSHPNAAGVMSQDNYRLLHRLRTSIPVAGVSAHRQLQAWASQLPLAAVMAQHAAIYARSLQLDALGFAEERDWRSAAYVMRDFGGSLVDVLLHSMGDTSPSEKHRLTRLSRIENKIKAIVYLADMLPAPSMCDWYWEICSLAAEASVIESRLRELVLFQNRLVPWSQSVTQALDSGPVAGPATADLLRDLTSAAPRH